tara:strand:- start:2647 stop:3453 length:807 start_codon:yes stop_codon:yes gene_type:complete
MGVCSSSESSSSSLALNDASLERIKSKIKRRLQDSRNISSTRIESSQNIEVVQKAFPPGSTAMRRTVNVKKGPIWDRCRATGCPLYGCLPDITQISNIRVNVLNSNIINESSNIFEDISSELRQQASTQMTTSGANAVNSALNHIRDRATETISTTLLNLSLKNVNEQQNISVETYGRCKDPCGCEDGPISGSNINQQFLTDVQSDDILDSALLVVEEELENHEVDVIQEISSNNDACIVMLVVIGCTCFICLLIVWKLIKMMQEKGK